jgi:hypothetical protein
MIHMGVGHARLRTLRLGLFHFPREVGAPAEARREEAPLVPEVGRDLVGAPTSRGMLAMKRPWM